jgi:hypothetical protein
MFWAFVMLNGMTILGIAHAVVAALLACDELSVPTVKVLTITNLVLMAVIGKLKESPIVLPWKLPPTVGAS